MKIVYVDGFHVRNLTGDMDFNLMHGASITFHDESPRWYIPENEIWVERQVKNETKLLLKSERLEKQLYKTLRRHKNTADAYKETRKRVANALCKKSDKNFVIKSFKRRIATIRVVNGKIVRKTLDPNFVMGGHSEVYPSYIPKGEIWLDGKMNSQDLKYILFHEEFEYELIKKGFTYNMAHNMACIAEKYRMIKDGVAFYPEPNPISPLPFIKVGSGKKRILITSGIHGDEPSGPYSIIKFLLSKNSLKNLNADLIPLINSTGFEKRTRENKNGKDLNRCFFDKSKRNEPEECKKLRKYFRKIKTPYELLISIHEDPERKKFYLYATGFEKNSPLIQKIFQTVKSKKIKLLSGIDDINLKNYAQDGYIGVDPMDNSPTSEEYLSRNKKVKKVIALEIPGKLPLDKKIDLVRSILKSILTSSTPMDKLSTVKN